jgi:hypothetical protein
MDFRGACAIAAWTNSHRIVGEGVDAGKSLKVGEDSSISQFVDNASGSPGPGSPAKR